MKWYYAPETFFSAPPQWGGLDLDSRSSGCARLGGGVGPPLGVVVEEVAVLMFFCLCFQGGSGNRKTDTYGTYIPLFWPPKSCQKVEKVTKKADKN